MARGRLEIEALARDGVAFHHDDETTVMVDPVIPPGLTVEALARRLQDIGRQHPDDAMVAVAMTPGEWLRVSRLIWPLGGGWPKSDAAAGPATRVGGPGPDLTSVMVGIVIGGAISLALWLVLS